MEESPAQKRHNNDIERCEEGRIGRGGHALPHHLQQERHAQDQPGYTAQQGIPRGDGTRFPPEDDPHNRCRNEEAQRYDQPGTELGINGHLGHGETQSPDQCHCGKHQIRNKRNLVFLHKRPP